MSITLRKPMKLVEKEIADLKRQVEDVYHDELSAAMEREIDQLIQDAAEEAQRLAEKQPQQATLCASASAICC
jgi:ATP-dependent Zn protease